MTGGICARAADRFGDAEANEETFAMTNIVPQTGDLNQFPWEKLESYSRSIARRGFDVYTIAGVYGDAGTIKGKIMVPTNCWKIILSVRPGRQLTDPASGARIMAVDMPNIRGIAGNDWCRYKTTVAAIEQKTGYKLLEILPLEIRDKFERSQP